MLTAFSLSYDVIRPLNIKQAGGNMYTIKLYTVSNGGLLAYRRIRNHENNFRVRWDMPLFKNTCCYSIITVFLLYTTA